MSEVDSNSQELPKNDSEKGNGRFGCGLFLFVPLAITWWLNGLSWWNWLTIPAILLMISGLVVGSSKGEKFNTGFGALILFGGIVLLLYYTQSTVEQPPTPNPIDYEKQIFMDSCLGAAETLGQDRSSAYQDCLETWNELQ